ncbi:helix-turn-helix transcriptional regulator [Rhodococcoides yunnanense]|uniref:Helix-turn-helix transcriptional regulator n=1 Tax=Rhodococcoides yunnanense TaxID=278209 RepID=A0ABU4B6J6_9NOCA|nr:helix-turn-helix transcriptional regulator [Rhodococcus yunnanensis]MDV6259812.1 helix-turn-helix transcriptional regulator [Rhodococcus yunnanensis]
MVLMDNQSEVSDFLTNRRGRLSPDQVGIIAGGRRRVPGLRREEVAMLAGVSPDYYVRMERGNLAGVSDEILDAVANTLRLNDAESEHLHDLARAAGPAARWRRNRAADNTVDPQLQRLLDAITGAPAWVTNSRFDTLATNSLGRALLAPTVRNAALGGNGARYIFLDPDAHNFYPEWELAADTVVASLRHTAGQNPHDRNLTDLVGELVIRSDSFRQRWAKHDVRIHRVGLKRIVHPQVGDLEFTFQAMDLPVNPGWALTVYTTEAGSPSEERISLLGSLETSVATTATTNRSR